MAKSTIDDFFGSSENAEKVCFLCGEGEEKEIIEPAVYDAGGVSHYQHVSCKKNLDEKKKREAQERMESIEFYLADPCAE